MTDKRHASIGIHLLEVGDPSELMKRRSVMRRARWLLLGVAALLAVGAARTMLSRHAADQALAADTSERARTYVRLAAPKRGSAQQTLVLPGTLQGYVQAPIAARAAGYLRRWTKDIGDHVVKGELLAELDAPELDQQLSQAVAARQQTASSVDLAKSTLDRWESLRRRDAVSQQDLEEKRSAWAQAVANLAAADANVQRLRELESYKRITAPFAGVITRRNVDVGDLIEGGGAGAGRPLFLLAQTDPLRVYVNVPQAYANRITQHQKVVVTQTELRERRFEGDIARTAASIDPATRTMQVEVRLPNRDGVLLPGAYVQVTMNLGQSDMLTIPANTLLFRAEGVQVAAVDAKGTVALHPVKVGRYLGESVEIMKGVAESDRLVINPSDSLSDGDMVATSAPGGGRS
jgi:RND family efflux transporter MFP subunit